MLSLKKAEDKMLSDILFPFLVKDRLILSKDIMSTVEMGPGKYNTLDNRNSPFQNPKHRQSNNTYNGSSATRFSDRDLLKNPGPGSYAINSDPLLEKSAFTFSKRFSPSAANIYL